MSKTVLITGAAGGIGRETARKFAKNGYHVALHYHNSREEAKQLSHELQNDGFDAEAFMADITQSTQVIELITKINRRFGGVDVLVNNAGIAQQKLFGDITEEEWDRMFAVNVKGAYLCTQAVLPYMIYQKEGKIVNISSIWGMVGASCEVHYSASKAALIGMTKALAKELGPSNIQVNCVAPGVIDTKMNAQLDEEILEAIKEETPSGTLGTGEDIANAISFLASAQADFITGQVLSPNGGFVI